MLALWDTTGSEIVQKLAAERRNAGGVATGLALTLVVIADEAHVHQVEDAAAIASSEHPCRLLIVVRDPLAGRGERPSRLDAQIVVGGRLGPCEAVTMRMSGRLVLHAESVVVPLLAPDVPVVTWWSGMPPERVAYDPLGVVAERRITDVSQAFDPIAELHQRADDYAPGDTDLSWTRLTPWRTLLANALDTATAPVRSIEIRASLNDPSALLLSGWLQARIGVTPTTEQAPLAGINGITLGLADGGEISMDRRQDTCLLRHTDQEDRVVPLVSRRLGDELAEELHRLGPDWTYATALATATGRVGLHERPRQRRHIWHDPALEPDAGVTT